MQLISLAELRQQKKKNCVFLNNFEKLGSEWIIAHFLIKNYIRRSNEEININNDQNFLFLLQTMSVIC